MVDSQRFSLRFYVHAVSRMLGRPRTFFSDMPADEGWKRSFKFLLVSGVIFTGAFLVHTRVDNPMVTGSILLLNAVGMTIIAAGLGYMMMLMVIGRRTSFGRFFSIYAYSFGITLLASWLPYLIWMTEPWKWWLIGTGLRRKPGLAIKHVLGIISLSIMIMVVFFGSLFTWSQ